MTGGRLFVVLGAFGGALAVAAGAFAAHSLRAYLAPDSLAVFKTGASYHLVHSVVLCLVGVWCDAPGHASTVLLRCAGWSLLAGIICFSGSLYVLALGGPAWLGPVTPFGGLALVSGWGALGLAAARR